MGCMMYSGRSPQIDAVGVSGDSKVQAEHPSGRGWRKMRAAARAMDVVAWAQAGDVGYRNRDLQKFGHCALRMAAEQRPLGTCIQKYRCGVVLVKFVLIFAIRQTTAVLLSKLGTKAVSNHGQGP